MPRYDVYRNPNPRTRAHNPYLLDVQADALSGLRSRVIVPLVPKAAIGERVASLGDEGSTILAALDLVLTGA